jgi:ASC-1-like (ASCH) protein
MENIKIVKLFFLATFFITQGCSEVSKARTEFINNFDLELTGRVIDVRLNQYGQKLVCLDVLNSNYKNYFPIYDPDKYLESGSITSEKRFFIKVKNDRALFIFRDNRKHRGITNHIVKGAIITINEDKKKSFRVYDESKSKRFGGLTIQTSPIRNNLEGDCL